MSRKSPKTDAVLAYLDEHPDANYRDVAAATGAAPGTVAAIISRLGLRPDGRIREWADLELDELEDAVRLGLATRTIADQFGVSTSGLATGLVEALARRIG